MIQPMKFFSAESILGNMVKSRKDNTPIICVSSSTDTEEEDLMMYLTKQYRNNYSQYLKDLLFGPKFLDDGNSAHPNFIIQKVQAHCYNSDQRKVLMRACLAQILKYKAKMSKIRDGDLTTVGNNEDLEEDEPPFLTKFEPFETPGMMAIDYEVFRSDDYDEFEKKRQRMELKKYHFKVKSQHMRSKMTMLDINYRHANEEKKSKTGLTKIPLTVQQLGEKGRLDNVPKSAKNLVSLSIAPSVDISIDELAGLEKDNYATEFERYYQHLKKNHKNNSRTRTKGKDPIFVSRERGLNHVVSKSISSEKINKLFKDIWGSKMSPHKEVKIRVNALYPKSVKESCLDIQLDQKKVGCFGKSPIPQRLKIRKSSSNSLLPNLSYSHARMRDSLAKIV